MNPSEVQFVSILPWIIGGSLALGGMGIVGWVYTTRLRIKNGYPLVNSWGMAIHKKTDDEAMERIKLLSQENAQLRAEIGAVKDRLANVERIVTDEAHSLNREIESLRGKTN
jgi:uncharacterized protein YlxW (UPF0749 family)